MRKPVMPTMKAEDDPEPWVQYWADVQRYYDWRTNTDRKAYLKAYAAKKTAAKTKTRQIEKLRELINKYPDEAWSIAWATHTFRENKPVDS